MKRYQLPSKESWAEICSRPVLKKDKLKKTVESILDQVRETGDQALYELTEQFDSVRLKSLVVSKKEIENASTSVSKDLKKAIQTAQKNIETFHVQQQDNVQIIETSKGVSCWRKSIAIEKVGLYIPGGSAPLFSSILMLGIPAVQAGCNEIVLCTPPNKKGEINPVILYTATLIGITKIFKVGGAQSIGAMAYGTETVPQVYKIFGPGNQFVTKAKEMIQQEGVAIDMPAGPSEVLIIADDSCEPSFVAADLLSQAEHGADSQVLLLSDDPQILEKTERELQKQLSRIPRKELAEQALKNSRSIQCSSLEECMELSNYYAPEHLIIALENADFYADKIVNAGSVFIGKYSCESAGDYASGTNHTLPTNGYARNYSGVSLDSFVRKVTFQKISKEGIMNIGPDIELMAAAEGLFAHKNAVSIRLKSIRNV